MRQAPPIVVIGFNRCATTSLHRMFELSGLASAHWQHPDGRNLARTIINNIALGLNPLARMDDIAAFSDLSYIGGYEAIEAARFFRDIHAAHPKAYFIFNHRPREDWIASRLAHSDGQFLSRYARATGLNERATLRQWHRYYKRHTKEVTTYFRGNPRFLSFDITQDDPGCVAELVAPHYAVETHHWAVRNRGPAHDTPAAPPLPPQSTPLERADNPRAPHADHIEG